MLCRHHSPPELLDELAHYLGGQRENPVVPDRVVVPHGSLAPWLKQDLAQRGGICANAVIQTWSQLVGALAAELLEVTEPDPWSDVELPWAIVRELQCLEVVGGELDALAAYVNAEHGTRRRVLLAHELTAVLRRTLLYRAGGDESWRSTWLGELYRRLQGAHGVPHPGLLVRRVTQAVEAGRLPDRFVGRLCVFGLEGASADHWCLVRELARHLDVRVLHLCPSARVHDAIVAASSTGGPVRDALSAIARDEAHPLLEALGRSTREAEAVFAACLPGMAPVDIKSSNAPFEAGTSILRALQEDVRLGRARGASAEMLHLESTDRSVTFHDCHSAVRELEVLRDELLRRMECSDLEPRDVLVLCADIGAMAPRIAHVFGAGAPRASRDPSRGWSPDGYPRLPFDIADRTEFADNEVAQALLHVLELPGRRFHLTDFLDLLALEPVRRQFGLVEAQVEEIAGWLEAAAVRWGLDSEHRGAEHRPTRPDFTWRRGLDRLLLGLAMQGEDQNLWAELLPVDDVEAGGARAVYGLLACAEGLLESIEALNAPELRSAAEWCTLLTGILDRTVRPAGDKRWQDVRVRVELDGLFQALERNEVQLDLAGVRVAVAAHLESRGAGGKYGAGRVTFAQLASYRVTPHRVIALVGMDVDSFPRRPVVPGYDAIAEDPRVGDAIPHEQDRLAVLYALLAAQDALIVTWSGHSDRSNQPHPPSVLVSELMDVVAQGYRPAGTSTEREARQALVVEHPLNPYSERSFSGEDGALPSVDRRAWRGARAIQERGEAHAFWQGSLPAPEPEISEVLLQDLVGLLKCPPRAILRGRLGVSIDDGVEVPVELDPLKLGGLEKWQLKDRLLTGTFHGRSVEDLAAVMRASGSLPLGIAGDLAFDEVHAAASGVHGAVLEILKGEEPRRTQLVGDLGAVRVAGRATGLFPGGRVFWTVSNLKAKYQLDAWVHHLALAAFAPDEAGDSWLVGWGKKGVELLRFTAIRPDQQEDRDACFVARLRLAELVQVYVRGMRDPLPFSPQPSLVWVEEWLDQQASPEDERRPERPDIKATGAWDGFDAGRDAHVQRVFGADIPLGDLTHLGVELGEQWRFRALAKQVFQPMIAHRVQEEG